MRYGDRGFWSRTKEGKALMDEIELAMLALRPWILDVLDGKGHIQGN
jgi:hypothetical protein